MGRLVVDGAKVYEIDDECMRQKEDRSGAHTQRQRSAYYTDIYAEQIKHEQNMHKKDR